MSHFQPAEKACRLGKTAANGPHLLMNGENMKLFLCLICLYPLLAFAEPIYFDKDIRPAAEKVLDSIPDKSTTDDSEDKDSAGELSEASGFLNVWIVYVRLTETDEFPELYPQEKDATPEEKNEQLAACVAHYFYCELYAVDSYGLTDDYLKYLKSDELDKASEKIRKNASKHSETIEDYLDFIQEEFGAAMKKTSPKLAQIYDSSRFLEARVRMFTNKKDKVEKKTPTEEVQYLMHMKEILEKRLKEADNGLVSSDDYPKTMKQLAADLRGYYRLSNVPDDFAYAFTDYLSAIDEFVLLADSTIRENSPDEILTNVILQALNGQNPLEMAISNEKNKAEWQKNGREALQRIKDAESSLNRIAIKYGLRY